MTALTLVVEAVNPIDLGALMIATQEEEVLLILDLVGEKQDDHFQRLLASVNIIAKEQVVSFGREATIFKQFKEIGELPVYVTAYFDRSL